MSRYLNSSDFKTSGVLRLNGKKSSVYFECLCELCVLVVKVFIAHFFR